MALTLTILMIAIYFGFMALFSFAKPTMGLLLAPGLSLCILLGASVILASFLFCLIYVAWANSVYDPAVRRLDLGGSIDAGRN